MGTRKTGRELRICEFIYAHLFGIFYWKLKSLKPACIIEGVSFRQVRLFTPHELKEQVYVKVSDMSPWDTISHILGEQSEK